MSGALARHAAPLEHIEVGEELTTCIHCGSRTDLISTLPSGARLEVCLGCGQHYSVTDEEVFDPEDPGEIEVVDVNGNVIGTTSPVGASAPELDRILRELHGGDFEPSETDLKEANQEDLDRLFGKTGPYGDKFGCF
jgi:hypothetical protein